MSVIKPVIEFFPFRKSDRFDSVIQYKETLKLDFQLLIG